METLDSQYIQLSQVSLADRTTFIKRTYKHLAGAVLALVLLEYVLFSIPGLADTVTGFVTSGTTWLFVLGGFMLATSYAEKMAMNTHNLNKQYAGLGLYVFAEAIILMFPLSYALSLTDGADILWQASMVTLALFGGLSMVVFTTGKDFSFLKAGLTIAGFVALGLIVMGIFFGINLGMWFSAGMVLLAAGSILYQTSNMVHHYSTDQHVAASLGLFASVMLLFWYILQIFLSRD